jgi:hypothetical protein
MAMRPLKEFWRFAAKRYRVMLNYSGDQSLDSKSQHQQENIVGNRDKRGREKKKPKKKEDRPTILPARPVSPYKPVTPPEPARPTTEPSSNKTP